MCNFAYVALLLLSFIWGSTADVSTRRWPCFALQDIFHAVDLIRTPVVCRWEPAWALRAPTLTGWRPTPSTNAGKSASLNTTGAADTSPTFQRTLMWGKHLNIMRSLLFIPLLPGLHNVRQLCWPWRLLCCPPLLLWLCLLWRPALLFWRFEVGRLFLGQILSCPLFHWWGTFDAISVHVLLLLSYLITPRIYL